MWIIWHNKTIVRHALSTQTGRHYIELEFLQTTVYIGIKYRISTALNLILHTELLHVRNIVWCIVLGMVICRTTHIGIKAVRNVETDTQIDHETELRQ